MSTTSARVLLFSCSYDVVCCVATRQTDFLRIRLHWVWCLRASEGGPQQCCYFKSFLLVWVVIKGKASNFVLWEIPPWTRRKPGLIRVPAELCFMLCEEEFVSGSIENCERFLMKPATNSFSSKATRLVKSSTICEKKNVRRNAACGWFNAGKHAFPPWWERCLSQACRWKRTRKSFHTLNVSGRGLWLTERKTAPMRVTGHLMLTRFPPNSEL